MFLKIYNQKRFFGFLETKKMFLQQMFSVRANEEALQNFNLQQRAVYFNIKVDCEQSFIFLWAVVERARSENGVIA